MFDFENLHNRIDLVNIPFTDTGSRLLLFRQENQLSIRLAERWTKWEKEVGHYRQRPPIIENFTFLDQHGTPQEITSETYPYLARLTTPVGVFNWTFQDPETLMVALPSGTFSLRFLVYAESPVADRRGGVLRGKRNIAYTTNARILANTIEPVREGLFVVTMLLDAQTDDVLLLNITPRMGFNRSLQAPADVFDAIKKRWADWFEATPPVLDHYRRQYDYAWWVLSSGLLTTRYFFTRVAMAPSKIHYVGVWHWDQFFHALAYRHVDAKLAEDQMRIILDHQRPDGMLPDAIHDEGLVTHLSTPVDADVTKPPLAAWTALKLYKRTGRLDFLKEVYEAITRWHQWWLTENVNENGLYMYRHPFSSGLDDSPLWDEGMPVVAPDLNTYLCIQMESLAQIAELIGYPAEAVDFRKDADALAMRMQALLWSERDGNFAALYNNQPIPTRTPFNLYPIWTGRMPAHIVERVLQNLTDPEQFWTEYPLATVALNDPKFNAMQMWRGPSWANINYLFVEALFRIGKPALAVELRQRTLNMIARLPDIYEYYNPITGERPPKSAPIFGWTSAVYIDLAIQETEAVERGDIKLSTVQG